MKKAILTIAALLLLATAAQAKKTPVEFYPGVEGYLPTPDAYCDFLEYAYTNELSEVYKWVNVYFYGMSPKDTLTFTKLALDKPGYEIGISIKCPLKAVTYKGKTPMRVGGLYSHCPIPSIKMNNVTFGSVSCNGLKKLQCADVENIYEEGAYDKGTVVKASGRVGYMCFFPQSSDNYGIVEGCIKSISAETFGDLLFEGTTPKCLVLKAGKPSPGLVRLPAGVNYKAKNVNVAVGE